MNGIKSALDTKPGTSCDVVTSGIYACKRFHELGVVCNLPFPHATANARALSSVSLED